MTNRFRPILAACILTLAGAFPLAAQTLHVIMVINTEDTGIGCIYDLQNWERELKIIESNSGMTVKKTVLKDDVWSVQAVSKALDAVSPAPQDAVIFYYSGHGFRWKDTSNQWPVMALQNDGWMELYDVQQKLLKKKPRLLLVLSDNCNSPAPYAAPAKPYRTKPSPEIIKANYRALFAEAAGTFIASGCIPGQYSLGGEPDGGVFTVAFMNALDEAVKTKGATWKAIMDESTQPLFDNMQQPQYSMSIKANAQAALVVSAYPPAGGIPAASPSPTASTPSASSAAAAPEEPTGEIPSGYNWARSVKDAKTRAAKEKKNIFALITAPSWCEPCRILEADVIADPTFQKYVNANFIPLYLTDDTNEYEQFKIEGWPTTLVMDATGKILVKRSGTSSTSALISFLKPSAGSSSSASAPAPAPAAPAASAATQSAAAGNKTIFTITFCLESGVCKKVTGAGPIKAGSANGDALASLAITVADPAKKIRGITYMVNDTEDWVENGTVAEEEDSALRNVVFFLDSTAYQATYRVHIVEGNWTDWFHEGEVAADWNDGNDIDAIELSVENRK